MRKIKEEVVYVEDEIGLYGLIDANSHSHHVTANGYYQYDIDQLISALDAGKKDLIVAGWVNLCVSNGSAYDLCLCGKRPQTGEEKRFSAREAKKAKAQQEKEKAAQEKLERAQLKKLKAKYG